MGAVFDYLQGRGVTFQVIPHRPAATAVGEAPPPGVTEDEVVETIVVVANFGHAIMVVPSPRKLDMDLVRIAAADREARLATERELELTFPDYEPGALPPLALMLLAPMYVDPAVVEREFIVFAAGRQDVSIRMATKDLFGTDPVVITPLTAESRTIAAAGADAAS